MSDTPTTRRHPVGLKLPLKTSPKTAVLAFGFVFFLLAAVTLANDQTWHVVASKVVICVAYPILIWIAGRPTELQHSGIRVGWRSRFYPFTEMLRAERKTTGRLVLHMLDGSRVKPSFAGLSLAKCNATVKWIQVRVDAQAFD